MLSDCIDIALFTYLPNAVAVRGICGKHFSKIVKKRLFTGLKTKHNSV